MTARAWSKLRQNWKIPLTPELIAQRYVAGPMFSTLNWVQAQATAAPRLAVSLSNCIVILGYWRSGTTLLHDYLSLDSRFAFPSTYACMNPQHFMLTQATALRQRPAKLTRRPMDDVEISAGSPQEEEFALLALGARSPYEGLLVPSRLGEALKLGDPLDLTAEESRRWLHTFEYFLRGVSHAAGNRPLVLKSPPHGYRVAALRGLLPNVRFALIVRSPAVVYESAVRMWRSLFGLYALGPIPPEEDTRRAVLDDRLFFESKLTAGLADLPGHRLALVRYENLASDPIGTVEALYQQLRLEGFPAVRAAMVDRISQRGSYKARNARPPAMWQARLRAQWKPIFERYGYDANG